MAASRPSLQMLSLRLALALAVVAALVAAGGAATQTAGNVTATTFVITGRGWGHGVGMSQWGAYGYAKRGVTYDRILAHYYPGTQLTPTPVTWIKVLLLEQKKRIVVSSTDPFRVKDGAGATHDLAAGNYELTSALRLKLDPASPPEPLPGPLAFLPGKSPLWLARPYRGTFTVSATGKTLSVVNRVAIESYVRGVVSSEMPHDWPLEAVKAQAVAARSFALAHRRGSVFDVYADTRDQVYGGIAAETPVGDQAVAGTRRQVLLYGGKVATTYYFSTSGGRTAAITDVFASAKPTPYLVSVPDPYDTASPYHTWGPVPVSAVSAAAKLHVPGLLDLQPVPASGRAKSVVAVGRAGETTVAAGDVRRALGLRSTWIKVGVLALSRPVGEVPPGTTVTLTGRVSRVEDPALEQRVPGSDWEPGPALSVGGDGTFAVEVAPAETTQYRLVAGTVRSAILRVIVVPT
jgi:stage II sporulation protein D